MSKDISVLRIDHVTLRVSDLQLSERWYDRFAKAVGLQKGYKPVDGEAHRHYWNRYFALSIAQTPKQRQPEDGMRAMVGPNLIALRVADATMVREVHVKLEELGIYAQAPQSYPMNTPGYYATFAEDPDGIRIEVSCVDADLRAANWDAARIKQGLPPGSPDRLTTLANASDSATIRRQLFDLASNSTVNSPEQDSSMILPTLDSSSNSSSAAAATAQMIKSIEERASRKLEQERSSHALLTRELGRELQITQLELERLREENDQMNALLKETELDLIGTTTRLLERKEEEKKILMEKDNALQSFKAETALHLQELKWQLATERESVKTLKQKLSNVTVDLENMQHRMNLINSEKEASNVRRRELESKLIDVSNQVVEYRERARHENEQRGQLHEVLTVEIRDMRSALNQAEAQRNKAESLLQQEEQRRKELEATLTMMKSSNSTSSASSSEDKIELQRLRDKIDAMTKEFENNRRQFDAEKQQLESDKQKMATEMQKIEHEKSTIMEMKAELDALTQDTDSRASNDIGTLDIHWSTTETDDNQNKTKKVVNDKPAGWLKRKLDGTTLLGSAKYDKVYCVVRGDSLAYYAKKNVIVQEGGALDITGIPAGEFNLTKSSVSAVAADKSGRQFAVVGAPGAEPVVFEGKGKGERDFWIGILTSNSDLRSAMMMQLNKQGGVWYPGQTVESLSVPQQQPTPPLTPASSSSNNHNVTAFTISSPAPAPTEPPPPRPTLLTDDNLSQASSTSATTAIAVFNVKVAVPEARNLVDLDAKSCPRVRVTINNTAKVTDPCPNGGNAPTWQNTLGFSIDGDSMVMMIEVLDGTTVVSRNDGVDISKVRGGVEDIWVDVHDKDNRSNGQIRIVASASQS